MAYPKQNETSEDLISFLKVGYIAKPDVVYPQKSPKYPYIQISDSVMIFN